ncbi:MAG: phospho-N-acetylmuramoyl-pentapeptide-transferase [Actinomycetota bacterium]|nr:phospho-N-acetylmuramoyl-pentapeptide-transferase [Actinomycetota bacterium]
MNRLLVAVTISLTVSIFGTRLLIDWLRNHRIGQPIREDGPQGHMIKAGTPTMGGVAIVGGALAGYVVSDSWNGIYTRTGIILMLMIVGAGFVGLLDDWIKVSRERNLGLSKRAKSAGLLTVAVAFAIAIPAFTSVHTELAFTRYDSIGIDLTEVGWGIWAVLLIVGSTNAVNLTDGLDGLASGAAILSFAAYVVIGFWQFRHPEVYDVTHALDLSVIAAAMLGACIGFIWWNAPPAQIFMGDAGALAIGGGLAGLALTTDTHLLLPIVGGLFVMETVSVMLQVARFRTSGKRFFRMAPIHHHFEIGGWPETTVLIRFWMIHGACVGLGLGLFYRDFIGTGAID